MRRKNLLSRVVTGNWLGVREGRGLGGTMAGTPGGVGFVCGITMSREPRQLRAFLRGTCGKQTTSPGCVFFVLVATDTSTLGDYSRAIRAPAPTRAVSSSRGTVHGPVTSRLAPIAALALPSQKGWNLRNPSTTL